MAWLRGILLAVRFLIISPFWNNVLSPPGIPKSHSPRSFCSFNASLPNITVYGTGGTIAGSGTSPDNIAEYQAGILGVETLVEAVQPHICQRANLKLFQFGNEDSTNVNSSFLIELSHKIQAELDHPDVNGAVVAHGTDTMMESAFFLDLTVRSSKPIVITGAMRAATSYSPDGPMNLLDSVTLASSEESRDRGVMVSLNSQVGSARYTEKGVEGTVHDLNAFGRGDLGMMVDNKPVFYYGPSRPFGHCFFNVSSLSPEDGLPQVEVLPGYQEQSMLSFQAAIQKGVKGFVIEGLGAGYLPQQAADELRRIMSQTSIVVIISRRSSGRGFVGNPPMSLGIGAGFLSPLKARVKLRLCLGLKLGVPDIENIFQARVDCTGC